MKTKKIAENLLQFS